MYYMVYANDVRAHHHPNVLTRVVRANCEAARKFLAEYIHIGSFNFGHCARQSQQHTKCVLYVVGLRAHISQLNNAEKQICDSMWLCVCVCVTFAYIYTQIYTPQIRNVQ